MGWIIVGDTDKYKDCLIKVCYGDRKFAEATLERMLNNPDEHDLKCMEGAHNFRVQSTKPEEEWWNDPFLAN